MGIKCLQQNLKLNLTPQYRLRCKGSFRKDYIAVKLILTVASPEVSFTNNIFTIGSSVESPLKVYFTALSSTTK